MIVIQANSLSLILKITEIVLEKGILPMADPNYPLEILLTEYQWFNLKNSIILKLADDIILGNIGVWDSTSREYLIYDHTRKMFEKNRQYLGPDQTP